MCSVKQLKHACVFKDVTTNVHFT